MANGGRIDFTVGYKVDKTGLNDIKKSLNDVKNLGINDLLNFNPGMTQKEARSLFGTLQSEIAKIDQAFSQAFDPTTGISNLTKLNSALKRMDLNKLSTTFKQAGAAGETAFNKIAKQSMASATQFKKTETILDKMGKTLTNTIKWNISSSLINRFTGSIQQAYGYVQHLDTSLNDIRIVTGKSADEMERFAETANKTAKAIGAATTEYTEAALIYYQQGLNDEEANARAETTVKAANVTGQSAQQVSEQLTAVWNGYKVSAEETEQYVDKLAAVAATTASDLEELSTGMSKVASAANNMGVNVDQLNGMLSTIISVTRQAPETAGTALKTIFARMEDLKISGEDEEGVKLGEVSGTLEELGIEVLDAQGNLRDLGTVIEEVAGKWDTWTKAQQNAAAQAMAGKRQYNNLLALFDNWDMYTAAVNTSRESIGTLQKQQDIYMESTEAKLQKLKTTWEGIYSALLNSDDLKSMIDGLTVVIGLFQRLITAIGGGRGLLLTFGGTALTVLRNQLGASLGEVINNMRGAKKEAQELAAQTSNIKLFENIQGKTTAYADALRTAQAELSKYYNVLTGEQIEAGTELAIQAAEIADQADQWNKATIAADEYLRKIVQLHGAKGQAKNINSLNVGEYGLDNQAGSRTKEVVDSANKALDNMQSKIDSIIPSFAKIQEMYKSLKEGHQNWEEAFNDSKFESKFNKIYQEVEKLFKLLDELQAAKIIDDKTVNKIKNYFKEIHKSAQDFKKDMVDSANSTAQVGNNAKKVSNDLKKGQKEAEGVKEKLEETNNTVRETVSNAETFNATLRDGAVIAQQQLSSALKDALVKNLSANFMQAAGGIASFAGGLTSLKSGFDALSNTDLSWGERILQFTTSFGMGLTTTLTGISQLRKGLSGLTDVTKLFTAEQQIELINSTSLAGVLDAEALVRDKLTVTKLKEKLVTEGLTIDEKYELALKYGLISAEMAEKVAKGDVTKARAIELAAEKLNNAEITKEILLKGLLIIKEKALAAAKLLLNKYVLIVAASVAAAAIAYGVWRHQVEETTKSIDNQAKVAQEQSKAAEEHNEKIKELVKSYKELKEEYGEDDIDILRDRVYKLCTQYGLEQEAIQALTASYTELDDIIKKVQQESASEAESSADRAAELTQASITRHIGQDNKTGFLKSIGQWIGAGVTNAPWLGGGQYIAQRLLPGTYSQIEGLTGLSRAWNKDLIDTLERYGVEVTNTGAVVSETLSDAFIYHGQELQEELSKMNSAGANQILQMMEDQASQIEAAQNEIIKRSKSHAEQMIDTSLIKTADDYRKALDQLVNDSVILAEFDGDKEKAEEWAKEWLNAVDTVVEASEKANLSDKVSKSLGLSTEQTDKYSNAQLTFLDENQDIARQFKDVNEFLNRYDDFIQAKDEKEVLIKLGVALESSDGEKFDEETINSLFDLIGDRFTMSQEEFLALDFSEQKKVLQDYIDYNFKLYREDYNNAMSTYNELYSGLEEKQKQFTQIGESHHTKVDMSQNGLMSVQALLSQYLGEDYSLYSEKQGRFTLTEHRIADFDTAIEEAKKTGDQKDINRLEAYREVLVKFGDDVDSVVNSLGQLVNVNDELEDQSWLNTLSAQLAPTIDNIKQLEEAYENGSINAGDYTSRYKELDKAQDLEGLDEQEVLDYSQYLQDIADSSNELSDELTDNAEAADIVSKSIMKMNQGVEELSSNYENWSDVLQNSSKMSKEYMDALTGMRKAMAKLLDISEDYVSENFLQENMEQIGKAAEGDAEAIDGLRKALSKDVAMNLELNDESVRNELVSSVENWQSELDGMNLEVGAQVNNESFISSMNDMIAAAGLSVDQVNALFDSMGYEATFASQEENIPSQIPITTVHHFRDKLQYDDKGALIAWDERETSETTYEPNDRKVTAFALGINGDPQIKTLTKKATGSFNNASSGNKGGNKSSSSGGSKSGGSESKPDVEKHLERENDPLREVNEELDNIESKLKRIQKANEHAWGATGLKTLKQENKLLEQQYDLLKKKKKISEEDLSTRRKQLEDQGVEFSKDGSTMTNAEARLDELYAEYNAMVDQYNSMSKEQQEDFKKTLESKKETVDRIEKAMSEYESKFNDYNSLLDELQEKHYELIANAVETFNHKINLKLELNDAKKEWKKFWHEVVKDVRENDFAGQIAKSMSQLKILTGVGGNINKSEINQLTNHVNKVTEEVRKQIKGAKSGGGDSIFGDDTKLSMETLTEYRDKLMEAVTSAKEEIDNMTETYLKALDDAQDKIDKQVENWEAIGDHIEHNIELIKMISGEKAFDPLNKQFKQQYENNLQLVEANRISVDYWKGRMDYYQKMMDTEKKGSKMYYLYSDALKKASENYQKAVSDLDKTIEDALKDLEEWRENQVSAIEDALDKALSNQMGLDDLEKEWDLVLEKQQFYLDNIERSIEMQELAADFDEVAESLSNRNALQQEFLKFQDEELGKLREKNKLTQYDIDEVRARLEIKKAELALDEARQNKSNLRLRRDSQGNYNYQYTSDEDQLDEAENGILSAKKEWYELVKKRQEEVAKNAIEIGKRIKDTWIEYQQALDANDEVAAANALKRYNLLIEYEKEIGLEGEKAKRDFYQGTAEFFADVNQNTVLPIWDTTIEKMIDKGLDFKEKAIQAVHDMDEVHQDFSNKITEIMEKAGVDYDSLRANGVDPLTNSLEDMTDTNDELTDSLDKTNGVLKDMEDNLQDAIKAYEDLKIAAVDAIKAANSAIETLARTVVNSVSQMNAAISAAERAASLTADRAGDDSGSGSSSENPGSGSSDNTSGKKPYILGPSKSQRQGEFGLYTNDNAHTYITDGVPDWLRKQYPNQVQGLRTGGYTGEWGDNSGRLAVLHQKELVLNQNDTSNMLSAVNALRDIVGSNTSADFSGLADAITASAYMSAQVLAQVGSGIVQSIASLVNDNSSINNYKNMTVNADFSGVRSADAIYQALMELDNYGTQQSYSNTPLSTTKY